MFALKNIRKLWLDVSYLPLVITGCISVGVIYIIFNQTQIILKERLRERITSIAALAAIQIDPEAVQKIINKEDIDSDALRKLTQTMRKIRNSTKDIKYIYILSPTEKPEFTQFVADADMIDPVDWDGSGIIDEVEVPPMPGDEYDITDNPTARLALASPAAADDVYTDKWGTFLSAYAPVRNQAGESIAVIGLDVQVDQFSTLIRAMFIPFLVFSVLLLLLLTIQTIALVKIWANRVEFVKELDRQKDELLGIVSHQLATPVSSVKWYLEMLMDGDLGQVSKEQKEHISTMQGIALNLSDLVSMILDVSRIQLGRMKIEKQELDLDTFFKEIIEVIVPKAKEKDVELNAKVPSSLPKAMLDKRYTRMTVENLLSNAVKYTPTKGKVDFLIEVRGNTLYCEVNDTGMGIPKAEQDKIFGKLFRASNARNAIDGNGFGLYVAKGAIEAQGGKIWFESEENKGTKFMIEVPLHD